MEAEAEIARVYREHAARMLAVLVRLFGTRNLELAEDVLQEAFRKALVAWQRDGTPRDPAGWIMAAAKNTAIDAIRAQRTRRRFADDVANHLESDWTLSYTVEHEFEETRIQDDELRMIFMCAGTELAPENRIPLMLRTLCGFGIPAICRALFLSEATVKKRLLRARERLQGHRFELPAPDELPHVMDTVHTVIYLLFNEGFHGSDDAVPLSLDLCREAVRLATRLVDEPKVVNQDTLGLLALMHLHLARSDARIDDQGHDVPIDLQDRARWDRDRIAAARGLIGLAPSVAPGASGRFLIEARIAEQHCLAATFDETDWRAIVALYDELVAATGSPIAELHRAVAVGYAGDPRAATSHVEHLRTTDPLRASHLPSAVLAHLAAMTGDGTAARRYAEESALLGGTAREQQAMRRQVERLLTSPKWAGPPPALRRPGR